MRLGQNFITMITILSRDSPLRLNYDLIRVQYYDQDYEGYMVEGINYKFEIPQDYSTFMLPITAFFNIEGEPKKFIDPSTKNTFQAKDSNGNPIPAQELINGTPHVYLLDNDFKNTGKYYLVPSEKYYNVGYDKLVNDQFLEKCMSRTSRYSTSEKDFVKIQGDDYSPLALKFHVVDIYINNKWVKELTIDLPFLKQFMENKIKVNFLVEFNQTLWWLDSKHIKLT